MDSASRGPARKEGDGHRAWAAFVRLDLMGPLDALVGLGELLGQEVEGKRPDEYLADVAKLQQAAARLLELARDLLRLDEATSTELEEGLRRARHDLGNRLNQLCGMVQLLQIQEEALFGALLPDLDKLLELCRECEARLLHQGSRPQEGEGAGSSGISQKEIADIVEQIKPTAEGSGAPAGLTGSVLVTDDDPINREVLRRLLTHEGHCVVEASDGHEALRLLGERSFDVVLLDILMPGLNGFEVLSRLQEEGRLRRTSVIVISALDEVHSLVRCLEAGADDYLTKPVDKVLLRARISSCLLKRRQRAQELEQFFPPEVVARLLDRPDLLRTGRTAEVTILFCDIRGFSRISERLRPTPKTMVEWISTVMEALDECVLRHQGVLIDFIGDELLAMWGSLPQEGPDHASRACRAALDMLACMSQLSDAWKDVVGEPTTVGIGINTGQVSVGNVGSRRRFKYGALGNTVNLTSRIQGATKYLKARILLTQSTRERIGDELPLRKLAQLQVVNIQQPVTVYELAPSGEPGWDELKAGYEQALALYEAGPDHLQDAAKVLGSLVGPFGVSGPNLFLLSRILGAMQDRAAWSKVYVLPGK
jgi:adenylate cyclase